MYTRRVILSSTVESVKYIVKGRSIINEDEESRGHYIKVFLMNILKSAVQCTLYNVPLLNKVKAKTVHL